MTDASTIRVLRQHLRTEQLLGVKLVPLGEPLQQPPVADAPVTTPEPTAASPAAPSAPVRRLGLTTHPPMPHDKRLELLTAMNLDEVSGCQRCPLHAGRTNTVFGEGAADAPIMFIGEGPGQNEDEQGRPFVGRAGDLLTKMIIAMGLSREAVYIANIVKCRPPNNRAPTPQEVEHCWDYLHRQISIIRPRVIITLGGPAMKAVLDAKEGITRLRGQWHSYDLGDGSEPIPVMPTFHPAYLLRAYTLENRTKVWSDLQAALKKAGLPQPPKTG